MKVVAAYQCDYCTRCFARKVNAIQHESACNANPERKNCKTCVHGCYGLIETEKPMSSNYDCVLCRAIPDYTYFGPFCDYHNIAIFEKPYNIECDCSAYLYGDGEETPDPGTCWNYEYKGKCGWTRKDASHD